MRIHLSYTFSIFLAHVITIAVRYSAVRFQGQNPNRNETRILDYPLQQDKLIPCLSTTYVFLVAFMKLDTYFNQLKLNENIFLEQLLEVNKKKIFSKIFQLNLVN